MVSRIRSLQLLGSIAALVSSVFILRRLFFSGTAWMVGLRAATFAVCTVLGYSLEPLHNKVFAMTCRQDHASSIRSCSSSTFNIFALGGNSIFLSAFALQMLCASLGLEATLALCVRPCTRLVARRYFILCAQRNTIYRAQWNQRVARKPQVACYPEVYDISHVFQAG